MIIIPLREIKGPLEPMAYELSIGQIAEMDAPFLINHKFIVQENIDDGRDDPCLGCFFSTGPAARYCGMMSCCERFRTDQKEVIFKEID